MLNSMVPISRFNEGEVNKIFDEVKETGCKIVVENNKPVCVLITPEKYEEMLELIEDFELYVEVVKREKDREEEKLISEEELLKELRITQEELDAMPDVEIG